MNEKKIEKIITSLGCSYEQAVQMLKDDEDIEQGKKKDWDLNAQQLENQRNMINLKPRTHKAERKSKERKENPDKRALIEALFDAVKGEESAQIANAEREITFARNGISYSVTLIAHRSGK